jgi:hypothetical protein
MLRRPGQSCISTQAENNFDVIPPRQRFTRLWRAGNHQTKQILLRNRSTRQIHVPLHP